MTLVHAEDINYWKSSSSSADTWIEKAIREIKAIGGVVLAAASVQADNRNGFMIRFSLNKDDFVIEIAALPCRKPTEDNQRAARVQAATILYHDVKHKCVMAKIKGARQAFAEHWLLPSGETVARAMEQGAGYLASNMPMLLGAGTITK